MAAKLHLQQAHGGDGSVEAGPGPGVDAGCASIGTPAMQPSAPQTGPVERTYGDDDDRCRFLRRPRPTPKPLHQPDRDVPADAMEELLAVWDKIGLNRLEEGFVHSTMVMKVFAARPEVKEQSLYEHVTPQGDNPFEKKDGVLATNAVSDVYVVDRKFTDVDLSRPFAPAPDTTLNPFNAGKVDNPFAKAPATYRDILKPIQQRPQEQKEEPVTAPLTPFGQLPMFGKHQQESKKAPVVKAPQQGGGAPTLDDVSSPFSSAVANSPFVGKIASPFSTPFEDAAATAMFEASQFTAASPFLVTGAQPASPFTAPDAVSPFAQAGSASSAAISTVTAFQNIAVSAQQEQSSPAPEHECPTCGKRFSTQLGASMHSKAKHGVVLETDKSNEKSKKRRVPDLPAYIPSPVDLSSTSPFGTKTAVGASWVETELIPHAQCMSNIALLGKVLDVAQEQENALHVTVFVQGDKSGEEETVTLCCFGDIVGRIRDTVKRNSMVFVTGTLRLLPVYEASNNRYYVNPVVHVALPTGTLAVIT